MTRSRGTLRVIAGTARGRRIAAPPGLRTRPMRDRVRESVFAALDARGLVASATVLDLFAGSGALGIEALSRGALALVAVESDPGAARIIDDNLRALGLVERGRVVRDDVAALVGDPPPPTAPFDLVFCDPPLAFGEDEIASILAGLAVPGWLAADAAVVVQRSDRAPPWPEGWDPTWHRSFGDTLIGIAQVRSPAAAAGDR